MSGMSAELETGIQVEGPDGTAVTVKQASVAPAAADPAMVVAISPNGAQATAALQTSGNATLTSIDGKTLTPGQKTMANSSPVVLASDQSSIPVTVAGVSTAALQTAGNASLTSIDAGIPAALGQTTMAASMPVVLASDQASIPVTVSGVSTAANQATEITALQLIDNPVGSVAPGTAGTSSYLGGSVFNTSAPAATNGQQLSLQSDTNGKIKTVDVCDAGGLAAALTVGTSAVLACAGGASANLANRKHLSVHNNGTVAVYWGTTNAVTTSTGTPITPGAIAIFTVGQNTNIYLISGTASQNTRIAELA